MDRRQETRLSPQPIFHLNSSKHRWEETAAVWEEDNTVSDGDHPLGPAVIWEEAAAATDLPCDPLSRQHNGQGENSTKTKGRAVRAPLDSRAALLWAD